MNRTLVMMAVAALVLAGCFGSESTPLEGRLQAAYTGPLPIADWIIQGRNDFLLVDMRPQEAFAQGHIPGAVTLEGELGSPEAVARSLPTYKKLVFYQQSGTPPEDELLPVFRTGAHVMILEGGYEAWQQQVMTPPGQANSPAEAKRLAISQHFRGESALGSAKELEEISADEYIQAPTLPVEQPSPMRFQTEGC